MNSLALFLVCFCFSGTVHSANSGSWTGKSYREQCEIRKKRDREGLEMLKASCLSRVKSPECDSAYQELDKKFPDPKVASSKKLSCADKDVEARYHWSNWDEVLLGCAAGVVVDPVLDLADAIGNGISSARVKWGEARDCDKSYDQKLALITAYNMDVPKNMRVNQISKKRIEGMSCNQVHVMLLNQKTTTFNALSTQLGNKALSPTQKQNLTDDEKEFLRYRDQRLGGRPAVPSIGILASVERAMEKYNIKLACYSPEHQARLRCEVAGLVATAAIPALFALRAARLAKLSGLKVEEIVALAEKAERKSPGLDGKLVNGAQKDELLSAAGQLNNRERVAAFEKMVGRKLTKEESDQLIKMHNVGDGKNFNTYEYADFKEKMKLGREINSKTGKPYFSNEEIMTAMRNGITGNSPATKVSNYEKYGKLARENPDSFTYQRLHAESAMASGKAAEGQVAIEKAASNFLKEKGTAFKNMSDRELYEAEYLLGASGKAEHTKHLKQVMETRVKKTENEIRNRPEVRNSGGASKAYNEFLQQEYQSAQIEARQGSPLMRKAAEEKLKVFPQIAPGLRP